MLETSKDVLYLLIGFCLVWLSLWFSWIPYQIGRTLKNFNKTIESIQGIVNSLQEGVNTLKDKTSGAAAYLTVLIKSGQQLMQMIQKKRKPSSSKKKNKNKK